MEIKNVLLPVFLVACILLFLLYQFFPDIPKTNPVAYSLNEQPKKFICTDNDREQCKINKCSGIRTCINNLWGECALNKICIPGTKTSCYEFSCSPGFKICDECGNYGECTYP